MSGQEAGKLFNNADSFGMSFDSAWESYRKDFKDDHETEEEKIFSYIEACVQSSRERFQSSDNGPTGAFSLTKD